MGSIMQGVFGGKRAKEKSYNLAYPQINEAFSPALGYTTSGGDALMNMLGLGSDPEGQAKSFQNFQNSTGYDFLLDSGSRAITGSNAAKGLLRSGATGKALTTFGQNLASTRYKDYMDQLMGLANLGLGAGGVLATAGQYKTGKSSEKPGIGGFLGSVLTGGAGG